MIKSAALGLQIVLNGRSAHKADGGAMVVPASMVTTERVFATPSVTPPLQLNHAARQSSTAIRSLADVSPMISFQDSPQAKHHASRGLVSHDCSVESGALLQICLLSEHLLTWVTQARLRAFVTSELSSPCSLLREDRLLCCPLAASHTALLVKSCHLLHGHT